jgi:hypothetical protein
MRMRAREGWGKGDRFSAIFATAQGLHWPDACTASTWRRAHGSNNETQNVRVLQVRGTIADNRNSAVTLR